MIRIREILDPELKAKVVAKRAEIRGLTAVPEWFELDDADYVDLLQELREDEEGARGGEWDDPRM